MKRLAIPFLFLFAIAYAQTKPSHDHRVEIRGAEGKTRLIVESYAEKRPDTLVVVGQGDAGRALKAVIVGVADVAMATDELPDEVETLAKERGVVLRKILVWNDAIVPVVSEENMISNITYEQLHDIFVGNITNWKEITGQDLPITVLSQAGTTALYETFRRTVLGDGVVTPNAKVLAYGDITATLASDPGAIAYVGLSGAKKLKIVAINEISASRETIADSSYPIIRHSCLWVREPTSQAVLDFVAYFASEPAKVIIKAQNSIPAVPR